MRGLLHQPRRQWAVALVCVLTWIAATSQPVQAMAVAPAKHLAASTVTLKPDVRGLEDIGGLPPSAVAPYLNGTVANETWADLQPTLADNQSNTIVHPNRLDTTIASLQKWSAYSHIKLKIRIYTGMYTPSWALNLDGPSFQMNDFSCVTMPAPTGCNGGSLTYSFPRWWGSGYQAAYDRLQQALGVAYDSNPMIDEVSAPRCMAIWDEPLVRPWDNWSMTSLLNAGYTEAADVACQEQQLTSQATAWPHTVVDFAVNYYTNIYWKNGVATRTGDLPNTTAIMTFCRQNLGNQCLFQNDELGSAESTPGNPSYSPIYPLMRQFGSPLSFQMDIPSHLMGVPLGTVLALAASWGTNSVEIQFPYFSMYPPNYFGAYNATLSANPWGQTQASCGSAPGPMTPISGDFNGDGKSDLAFSRATGTCVSTSTGTSLSAAQPWSFVPFFGTRATLAADVNGDGMTDLVAINDSSVWVMLSTGSSFSAPQLWSTALFYGSRATLAADVNHDGKTDLVAVNDGSVWVMLNTGTGFAPPAPWSTTPFFGSRSTLAADVNGDGRADLVAVNDSSTWVMRSTGSSFSAPEPWSSTPFYGNRVTVAADVTGNGNAGLVAVNDGSVWVMPSTGSSFAAPQPWSTTPFYGSVATQAADVTGDRRMSLVAVNNDRTWVEVSTGSSFGAPTPW